MPYLFNTLNDLKTKIHEAESIIDESLRNKYDILMRVSNHLKSIWIIIKIILKNMKN